MEAWRRLSMTKQTTPTLSEERDPLFFFCLLFPPHYRELGINGQSVIWVGRPSFRTGTMQR